MRKAIQIMIESDPEIRVVGMARDGQEGVDMVRNLKPDCITLDLEMPRMNGLEALDIIMRETPTPTLVVSSISTEGAEVTLEALDRGAMDYIPKTQSFVAIDIISIKEELLRKIKSIVAHAPTKRKAFMEAIQRRQNRAEALENNSDDEDIIPIKPSLLNKKYQVLAIGVSTGGPPVVQHILENLPGDFPVGVMVAQHMPAVFTKPFAERLNKLSALNVKEAEHGEALEKGRIALPRDELLLEEALSVEWQINSGGRIQILGKDLLRKELGRSPDRLDSVVIGTFQTLGRIGRSGRLGTYRV